MAKDLDGKHAIKQMDRFFSNTGVDVWNLFASWVPFVVGERPEDLAGERGLRARKNTLSNHPVTRSPDLQAAWASRDQLDQMRAGLMGCPVPRGE